MKKFILSVVLCSLIFSVSFANTSLNNSPKLRAEVTVQDEIVTLKDLVENAGDAGKTAVFRAPDLGTRGSIFAWRVVEAAEKAGLKNIDTLNLNSISVTRAARILRAENVSDAIQAAVAEKLNVPNVNSIAINFDYGLGDYTLESTSIAEPTVARIDYNPQTQRFDALLTVSDSRIASQKKLNFRGTAVEMVNVIKLSRPVNKAVNISADDFEIEAQPKHRVASDMLRDVKMLDGLNTRRALPAGIFLRMTDLEKSRKVQKNETVTIIFESSGISLSMRGKAMLDGTMGDIVPVQNLQTKKLMDAKVVGLGLVAIEPPSKFQYSRNVETNRTKLSLKE